MLSWILSIAFVVPASASTAPMNAQLLKAERQLADKIESLKVEAELHTPEQALLSFGLSRPDIQAIKKIAGKNYFSFFKTTKILSRTPVGVDLVSGSNVAAITMINTQSALIEVGNKKVVFTPSFEVSRDMESLREIFSLKKVAAQKFSFVSEAYADNDWIVPVGVLVVFSACIYWLCRSAKRNMSRVADSVVANVNQVGTATANTITKVGNSVSNTVNSVNTQQITNQATSAITAAQNAITTRAGVASETDSITPITH